MATTSTTVVLNPAAVHEMLNSRRGPVGKDLTKKAIKVTSGAKRRCPVKTGRLRSSIRWDLMEDGKGLFARVGTEVEYAAAVHNGTRGRKGQPFLEDSLQDIAGQ